MAGMSIPGMGSGLDTESIINQLMQIEARPRVLLTQRKAAAQSESAAWGDIKKVVDALSTASSALSTTAKWSLAKVTSSDTSVASVASATGSPGGSVSFTVDSLASAGAMVSTSTVSSLSTTIASGPLVLAKGTSRYGIASFGTNDLSTGSHTLTVTQASSAAVLAGSDVSSSITIDGTNDTLSLAVDGASRTVTLAAGTYSRAQLATAVQTAVGSDVSVTLDGSALKLQTIDEGSAATLAVTGGTALASLGLSASSAAGTDGRVSLDGTSTVVSDVRAGVAITLNSTNGTSTQAALSGGLRTGTSTLTTIDTGTGSVSDVVSAINRAQAGMSAAAVQVSAGVWRFQVSSSTTGTASQLAFAADAFQGLTMTELSRARDAQVTIGSGAGAYSVTSSTNTFSSLLSGASITVAKESATAVTVSSTSDPDALSTKTKALVDATNAVIDKVKTLSAASTTNRGILSGNSQARRLLSQVYSTLSAVTSDSKTLSSVGITLGRDGRFSFDADKFDTAYEADPTAVSNLFRRVDTSPSAAVSLNFVPAKVLAGTYQVTVTQDAEKAVMSGSAIIGSTITSNDNLTIQVGTRTASYAATAGETLETVAAGLTAAAASANLGVVAEVNNGVLRLSSTAYGSRASFSVTSSSGSSGLSTGSAVGVDIAGTFARGATMVSATGSGQMLTADSKDAVLGGLAMKVNGSLAGAGPTDFTVTMGAGAALESLSKRLTDATNGLITTSQKGRTSDISDIDRQISSWTTRLAQREKAMRDQFTRLESSMSQARNTNNWLSGQISGLSSGT